MTVTRQAIGAVIEQALDDRDITRKVFIARTGLSKSYLSEIITGTKMPTLITLIDMATALGMNASELLQRAETHEHRMQVLNTRQHVLR